MPPRGTRTAVYCRISKDADRKGLGVERQEKECRALARRNGWKVVEVYVDNDTTAYRGKRPDYERLLDDMKAGAVDALVAWHPDRLHRQPRELEDFIDVVDATGVKVATVTTGSVDLSTPAGRMTARHLGTAARYESEHRSERLVSKHEELASDGRWKGGPRPYGYDVARGRDGQPKKDGRLVIVRAEAKVIREAARRVLAGESVYGICQDLNRRGVPTAQGKTWRTPTLRRILTNPTTAGRREHRGEVIGDAAWEAIVTEADRLRLRSLLMDEGRAVGRRPRSYLLTGGIARCGKCGKPLHSQRRGNGARVYACIKSVDKDGCGGLTCAADPLEALVTEALLIRLDSPALMRAVVAPDGTDEDENAALVVDLEERMSELAEMFSAGEIGRGEWLTARTGIERRLNEARRQQSRTDRKRALLAFTEAGSLRRAWPALTLDQRRAVIEAVIERVTINPSKRRGPIFDDERVDVTWRA